MKEYILFIVFLLFSCTNNHRKEGYNITTSNCEEISMEQLSEKVSKFELIALETNTECLLGTILKISKQNDDYYILTTNNAGKEELFVFNEKGDFKRKMGSYGKGKEEYLSIKTFYIDNGILNIFDDINMYIYRYSIDDNKFIDKIKLGEELKFIHSVHKIDDDNLLLLRNVSFSDNKNIYSIYSRNFTPKEVLKKTDFTYMGEIAFGIAPVSINKEILMLYPLDNTIYKLNSNQKITESYHLDILGEINDNRENDYDKARELIRKNGTFITNSIYAAGDYLVINYSYGVLIFNTKDNDCLNYKMEGIDVDDLKFFPINPLKIVYSDGEYFYALLDTPNFINMVDKVSSKVNIDVEIIKIREQLNNDSNPIIMKFKIK